MRLIILVSTILVCISFAQTHVSGNVSGIWGIMGSPYLVDGNIHIPTDDSLLIMPGCSIVFTGHFTCYVDSNAVLKALGSETDSIFFIPQDTGSSWGGIQFLHSAAGCTVAYCRIESVRGGSYGAVYCYYSDPAILNSSIMNNEADEGAGIFCHHSNPIIQDNYIYGNTCDGSGGGILCEYYSDAIIERNIISHNSAEYGAGISCSYLSNSQIISNIISENVGNSDSEGGGIRCSGYSDAYIKDNLINNNQASCGAGIYCSSFSYQQIISNIISGNLGYYGGGICCNCALDVYLENNLIDNNRANIGAAIHCAYSRLIIINCTITENQTTLSNGIFYVDSSSVTVFNSILWNNTGFEIYIGHTFPQCTIYVAYTNIDLSDSYIEDSSGIIIVGDGNINVNPFFADTLYHLSDSSACINAGAESLYILPLDTTIFAPTNDIEGNPRPIAAGFDMGAYEFIPNIAGVFHILTGWNLISYPFTDRQLVSDIFPYSSPVYGYDPIVENYYSDDEIEMAIGYWLMAFSDTVVEFYGSSTADSVIITLYPGWNLIGGPAVSVPESALSAITSILLPLWTWDANSQNYNFAFEMSPGHGYWLLALDTIDITLP